MVRNLVRFCGCFLLLSAPLLASPQIPGAPQTRPIALVGGTVHPVSAPAIEQGTVVFIDGKLTAVGRNVPIPEGAEQIDCRGRHVYPGLFDADSHLGLVEIQAVRATVDEVETGRLNPNVKSLVAVNPDSELIPVTRSNGVLVTVTSPDGPLIAGKSAIIQLDGWTYEDMAIKTEAALCISWPRITPIQNWPTDETIALNLTNKDDMVAELRRFFADARAYRDAKRAAQQANGRPPEHDLRLEAMQPVLEGKLPVVVEAEEIQQIQSAVAFAQREGVKLIIFGGYDTPHCIELLKKHDIPVIIAAVLRLPMRPHDPYDAAFTVAQKLQAAGVRFCMAGVGRMGNMRNLPYHAAMAAAHGLPRDEALKGVTLYPAQIFGVADRLGSLEAGKDATVLVTTGDPLEVTTHVERAYIQGRAVDLNDRHKTLWHKYQEKYRRLGIEPPAEPSK